MLGTSESGTDECYLLFQTMEKFGAPQQSFQNLVFDRQSEKKTKDSSLSKIDTIKQLIISSRGSEEPFLIVTKSRVNEKNWTLMI